MYFFFQKAHFIHFQMRYSSLHCCKYLPRYKIKHVVLSNCHFSLGQKRVRVFCTFPRQTLHIYMGCCPNRFDIITDTKSQIMTSQMMTSQISLSFLFQAKRSAVLKGLDKRSSIPKTVNSLLPQKVLEL